jgi:hypothetical protein
MTYHRHTATHADAIRRLDAVDAMLADVCADARDVREKQRRLPDPSERETLETVAVSDAHLMATLGRVP